MDTGASVRSNDRIYEDYVSHIIDAEQYEAFKEQDGARERELRERIVVFIPPKA